MISLPGTDTHPTARLRVIPLGSLCDGNSGSRPLLPALSDIDGLVVVPEASRDTPFPRDAGTGAGVPTQYLHNLHYPPLLDNFLARVYCHACWRQLLQMGLSKSRLQHFHGRYKYLLMASDREEYRRLGQMVAQCYREPDSSADIYFRQLLEALQTPATRKSHTNVLQHLAGYLKRDLGARERQHLHEIILQYHAGSVPLERPVTALRKYFRVFPHSYIAEQAYLQPYPEEIRLRHLF